MKPRSPIGTAYLAGKLRLLLCGSILAAIFSFGVYLSNGRTDRSGDTVPASLIPVTVLLHGTTMLDSFAEEEHRRFANPYWLKETPYGAASRYPLASGILSIPIYAVPVLLQQCGNRRSQSTSGATLPWTYCRGGGVHFRSGGGRLVLVDLRRFRLSPMAGCCSHRPFCLRQRELRDLVTRFIPARPWQPRIALRNSRILGPPITAQNRHTFCWFVFGAGCSDQDQQFASGSTDRRCSPFQQPRFWQLLLIAPALVAVLLVGYNETVFGSLLGGGQRETGNLAVANIPSGLLGSFFSPARAFFCTFPLRYWLLLLYRDVQAHCGMIRSSSLLACLFCSSPYSILPSRYGMVDTHSARGILRRSKRQF